MLNKRYIIGLMFIILVVWLTMLLCLIVVLYLILPIAELSAITHLNILILDVLRLALAGFILIAWLYSWNKLVKLYFQRNLSRSGTKSKALVSQKRRRNTRMIRNSRKPTS